MRIELFDIFRGVALLAMIFFHGNYMALHLFGVDFNLFSENIWQMIGFVIGVTFITLSGYVNAYRYKERSFRENMKRGQRRFLLLLAIASGISLITYIFFYEERISWGIIHFFALASLLQPLFSKFSWWIFPSIFLLFLLSKGISSVSLEAWYFVPFGIYPHDYFSADYYPLLPWFGYLLLGQGIGLIIGKFGIENKLARLKFPRLAILRSMGKRSLLIYIIHTPIIYLLFSFLL